MRRSHFIATLATLSLSFAAAHAQVSLSTAVSLALKNDPKIGMAQAEVTRAKAALTEAKFAYVPSVSTRGGIGSSAGVPLDLPVVFSVSAQSLVFNFSQPDYIRAAAAGVAAATFALQQASDDTVSEVVSTYLSLDSALQRRSALAETASVTQRLGRIVDERFAAGIEPHIEVSKTKRTTAQLRVQQLQADDDVAGYATHLAHLTGLRTDALETVHASIPPFLPPSAYAAPVGFSPGLRAADANATAKQYQARGESRYKLRPQLALGANYSRISTVGTNYTDYYPGFNTNTTRFAANSLNSLDIGIQITVPIIDLLHTARARQTAAEASKARFQVADQQMQFLEAREKLHSALATLTARVELAVADRDIAQDQLDAVQIQLQPGATTPEGQAALSPKDEVNARLGERQKYLDFLNAEADLRRTEVQLMGQSGTLGDWLRTALPSSPSTPAINVPHP